MINTFSGVSVLNAFALALILIFSLCYSCWPPETLSNSFFFFFWHNIHFDFIADSIIILSNNMINCYSYPAVAAKAMMLSNGALYLCCIIAAHFIIGTLITAVFLRGYEIFSSVE